MIENFEIVASQDEPEKIMRLVELPSDLPELAKNFICLLGCERISNPDQKKQCQNKC